MRWPFQTENRASATDAIVTALIAQAGGSSAPPSAGDLAAVEAAAGLWSRAFASATVKPSTSALSPGILAAMGRGLAVRGDVLFAIDVQDGLALTQASTWEVEGGIRPESWSYLAEFPLPGGGKRKRTLPANSVIHLRYATRPSKPWEGVSPLGMASETQALAAWLEKRLAEEVSTVSAYMLALPEAKSSVEGLKADLKKGGGRLHIVDTMATAWGDGKDSAPRREWESSRLGASPPEAFGEAPKRCLGRHFWSLRHSLKYSWDRRIGERVLPPIPGKHDSTTRQDGPRGTGRQTRHPYSGPGLFRAKGGGHKFKIEIAQAVSGCWDADGRGHGPSGPGLVTTLNYRSCFYFLAGMVIGCAGHEAVARLLGW